MMGGSYSGINDLFNKLQHCINFIIILGIILIIIYYILGIYILVDSFTIFMNIEENCNSKLWYYALLSLVGFTDKLMLRNIESISSYSNIYYILFFIELVLIIFGSIELFNRPCVYSYFPKDSKLYNFGIFNYCLQIILITLLSSKIIIMNMKRCNSVDVEEFDNLNERQNVEFIEDDYNNNIID